ncbi:hypothetical protein [Colwellia ponticola]|uniref:Uncharacterized protein n=1 Tax=Colwellia ponticola TaxID=2304625 RepID=A0A8H2PJR4_9GAMM|nr:hypothetical protein [Colwellia ponticola]TMM42680.1 hypothetical protein FCS21_14080 [Colwellia ponticola]
MRKLLSSPVNMALNDAENAIYQNALKYITPLSLNLMAVKVENRPNDFLGWCAELLKICRHGVNKDLLDNEQVTPLSKLDTILVQGASISQLKMLRIAPWPIYTAFIEQQSELHAVDERLLLLDYLDNIKDKTLSEMSDNDRLAFAGKHTNSHHHTQFNFDVEWFASTKGAKTFHTLLIEQPESFDKALAHIPLVGDVTPDQYRHFVDDFKAIFSNYTQDKPAGEKAPLVAATRLLTMRRPDQFIALTNAKIDVLCQGLSIAKFNAFDFESYWQDMIGTLRTFAWWHQAEPENEYELTLWRARAALIDVFLFVDEDFALGSNYLRIRDKSVVASERIYKSKMKRTKLTPEELVDQALAADDMPEYIRVKRDTILREVKTGKTVEHVIGLMRAIFG